MLSQKCVQGGLERMNKRTQCNRKRWHQRLLAAIFMLLMGCSQINDLPRSSEAAFALPDVPRNERTFMETFVVKATMSEAMKAAEQALAYTRFEERPGSWTNERRCGQRITGWYDWAVWGCFYFARGSADGTLNGRVITESWRSFGLTTRLPWDSLLTSAFQNRLRTIQEGIH